METHPHTIEALFEQLGLDAGSIDQFIADQAPIPSHMKLWDAPCWSASQAKVLQQMKDEDADWSDVVDQLDVMMRQ
ncbi:DUF2789 domain-containing protein [Marinomonas piezotolerans]|uniref:DUF2789 domain-containing protein n=1 Tax=Marinomonas piezotolerans TaxID=2213058 RepID=A0A370U5N8_9GAMM|nr:DUF2789 family protein [Marinomonas piezotolerans]RDL43094.1 DUF2789 domain-containing protein [Marinomonas piezotolerans]